MSRTVEEETEEIHATTVEEYAMIRAVLARISGLRMLILGVALLNYSYALLQTYVRRAISSIGLDNSIPFLHDMRKNYGLVYDMMELWRTNCDYSVLQTLEQLKRTKNKTHHLTDGFEVVLDSETIKLLFEKLRFNLSLEEIILNCRLIAKFLLGKSDSLSFNLRAVQAKAIFENEELMNKVLKVLSRVGDEQEYSLVSKEETRAFRFYSHL